MRGYRPPLKCSQLFLALLWGAALGASCKEPDRWLSVQADWELRMSIFLALNALSSD